jgi:thiamine-phosphate pyrophosphorylase
MVGRHAQVGSEHLLWGLITTESSACDLLQSHGVDREAVDRRVTDAGGISDRPLDVDFVIDWNKETESDRTGILRVLDAAANRAREGLRVVEDFVRFTLDDAHLTRALKECRHRLARLLQEIDAPESLACRDTLEDVGTGISTQSESQRQSPADVAAANFKRLQEATRTLEEFSKIQAPALGEQFGQLRYRLYTLEKAVLLTEINRRRLAGRNLYLLVTQALCFRGPGPVIREALSAGVGIVQIREKSMPDKQLVEYAQRVRAWTREAGGLLIINDRPDLTVLADADGVHVGQEELSVREARRIVGPNRIVGFSTHSIEQARQAVLDGADYIGVGPVFPSTTKDFEQLAGLEFVRQVAAEITLPWFAIGGINADNLAQVTEAGATRIAVASAVSSAQDPATAAKELSDCLCANR